MAGHWIDSSHLGGGADATALSATRFDHPNFSPEKSFASPSKGKNDLLGQIRGMGRGGVPATPRAPLANLRQAPSKKEFTPLLKSATRNRMFAQENALGGGGLETPAALRPGFKLDGTPLPEASVMFEAMGSSEIASLSAATPGPPVESSSAMSTPLALPGKRGEAPLDGGNVLTLKEQEAKLEQIDKENFGLKLKIHFLEENLHKAGPEGNQRAIRENTELKVDKATMQLEIKKYSKSLKQAELELEQYRRHLSEYAEKIKRRHADEGVREEMEELRKTLLEREAEIDGMREKMESADQDEKALQNLRDDVMDLEADLRDKERLIEEKEDEMESLQAKLRSAESGQGADAEEREKLITEQAEQIELLESQLRVLNEEKEEALDEMQNQMNTTHLDRDDEIDTLQQKLDDLEEEKRKRVEDLEERLRSVEREKDLEIRALQRQIESTTRDKQGELDSLVDRLRLAESKGDNQVQLAQQAAQDLRDQLLQAKRDSEEEMEALRGQLDAAESAQGELEHCRQRLRDHEQNSRQHKIVEDNLERELDRLQEDLRERETEAEQLKAKISQQEKLGESLRKASDERDAALQDLEAAKSNLSARDRELTGLRGTVSSQEASLAELQGLKAALSSRTHELETARTTLQERTRELEALRAHSDEPDSQLEAVQNIVRERDQDLEALRAAAGERERALEAATRTADDRLRELAALREEHARKTEELEEEIDSLCEDMSSAEAAKRELQARATSLEAQLAAATSATSATSASHARLEADLRAAERERAALQNRAASLGRDLDAARADLAAARGDEHTIARERRDLHELLKAAKLEGEALAGRLRERDGAAARAGEEARALERRHGGEVKGLVRQIGFLKASLRREGAFRAGLGWQKRFFVMQAEMFTACNKADLRLLADLGVTADPEVRARRPTLRAAALAVVAAGRMARMAGEWAASRRVHESILRKAEAVRAARSGAGGAGAGAGKRKSIGW